MKNLPISAQRRAAKSQAQSDEAAAIDRARPTPPHPEDYRPYNQLPEFKEGYAAYSKGNYTSPYDPNSVAAQAWDRGLDYAMRLNRYNRKGI